MGRFTAVVGDRATRTTRGIGTFNFTASNGDELFTRTAGAETGFIPPNISMVTATATVLGGTGRFERATGTFTIDKHRHDRFRDELGNWIWNISKGTST